VTRTRQRVAYGKPVTVDGWLEMPDGTAVASQPVTVLTAPDNGLGQLTRATTATMAANWSWTVTLPAGPSAADRGVLPRRGERVRAECVRAGQRDRARQGEAPERVAHPGAVGWDSPYHGPARGRESAGWWRVGAVGGLATGGGSDVDIPLEDRNVRSHSTSKHERRW
jgi:hypothetical protein